MKFRDVLGTDVCVSWQTLSRWNLQNVKGVFAVFLPVEDQQGNALWAVLCTHMSSKDTDTG